MAISKNEVFQPFQSLFTVENSSRYSISSFDNPILTCTSLSKSKGFGTVLKWCRLCDLSLHFKVEKMLTKIHMMSFQPKMGSGIPCPFPCKFSIVHNYAPSNLWVLKVFKNEKILLNFKKIFWGISKICLELQNYFFSNFWNILQPHDLLLLEIQLF